MVIGYIENLKNECFEDITEINELNMEKNFFKDKPLPEAMEQVKKIWQLQT